MERLMQYVWQHRLWLPSDMKTVDGVRVDVIDPGLINHDSGPDFFNAKLRIGDRMWAGNVEIHVRASDWHRHGHHLDPAYDTVVLHVVERSDAVIMRSNGEAIPQVVMPCVADFSRTYSEMVDNKLSDLPCAQHIGQISKVFITDWVTALALDRLRQKADRVMDYNRRFGGDWRQTLFAVLCRALGFGINSEPFERLAAATPMKTLMKHRDSLITIEAALFGQAGLLDSAPDDDAYVRQLRQEYAFMAHKYDLHPLLSPGWRMGRMRPQNFPHRRIATLAALMSAGFVIGYNLFSVRNTDDARRLFDVALHGYWTDRYSFGEPSAHSPKALSRSSIDILVINVVIPMLFAYGTAMADDDMRTLAMDMLQQMPAENNSVIRLFAQAGIECPDALSSQALIHLRRSYCEPRKCLYCRIGHRYLASKAIRR